MGGTRRRQSKQHSKKQHSAEADKEEAVVPLAVTKMVKLQQVLDLEDQMALQGHLGALAGQEVEAKMEEQVAMVEMETMEQLL